MSLPSLVQKFNKSRIGWEMSGVLVDKTPSLPHMSIFAVVPEKDGRVS